MRQRVAGARVVSFSKYRRFAAAAGQTVRHKQIIHGVFDVDVTAARAAVREHRARTGESLSFTAFIVACVGKAVDEHRDIQAFRLGGRRLVIFDDVDVNTRIERDVHGQKYVVPYIIRAANRKSFRQIHDEIRAAQTAAARDIMARFNFTSFMPAWLFGAISAAVLRLGTRSPRLWKSAMGTVGVTSVGMFGNGAGWGIPAFLPTALMVTVGGIGEKPVIVDGRLTTREYLSLTISVDHDIVDGAPAARFTQRLKALIESAYSLESLAAPSPRPVAAART